MSDLGTTSESNDPGVNQSNENIVEADEESSSPAVDQSVVDVVGSSDPEVAAENEGDDSTEVVDESDVGESVHRTEVERLKVSVDHVDDITYALAYNRAPVIRRITITNELGGLSGPLTVTASLKWSVSEDSPSLPFSTVIELPGFGDSIALDTLDFRLDDAVMVNVNETAPARLEIQIVDALGQIQTWSAEVKVHARNQWLSNRRFAGLTAAFVQPNHPRVNDVLAKAGEILERRTGSRSLSGYQEGEAQVRAIGEAIFLALQTFVDQYINPPASYGELGQKLRPIDEVLAQRQGTCIDLACAYASCLEQAGLHPIVFLVHGHAFTGFFLDEHSKLNESVVSSFSSAVTLIESGLIVAAETVALCGTDSFDSAVHAVRGHFTERSAKCPLCGLLISQGREISFHTHLEAMVDIRRSHEEGILPLPVRFEKDGVVTVIIDRGPEQPVVVERRDGKTRKLLESTAPARVQQWKNSLLDLTFRNTLLNYKPARTGAEIIVPKGILGSIEDLLSEGRPLPVIPHDDLNVALVEGGFRFARDLSQDVLEDLWRSNKAVFAGIDKSRFDERLRRIASKAKVEEQDTGSNNLFMTFGTLKWRDPKASVGEVCSPIFMIPIKLKIARGGGAAQIVADPNGFTTINYCLIEALRTKMKMTLQWFSDDMRDAAGLNVDAGLQAMRQEILASGHTANGFEVIEDASIGLLRFTKIRLWKDLDEHWETFANNSIISHLIEGGRGHYVDPADPERLGIPVPRDFELLNPQPADGPQAFAVRRALAGHSFVLEGPPGTGKSQTITNLLAAALANGKKVLFVAEKQAALEVVHERLTKVGLDPFCLELHDKGAKPEKIKEQLRSALDFRPDADLASWERLEGEFEQSTNYLDTYRDKIHGVNEAGMSYFDAYVRLLRLGDGPIAKCTRRIVKAGGDRIDHYRAVLTGFEDVAAPALPRQQHPWAIAGPMSFESIDRTKLIDAISALSKLLANIDRQDSWRSLLAQSQDLAEVAGVKAVVTSQTRGIGLSVEQWREVSRPEWAPAMEDLLSNIDARLAALAPAIGSLGPNGLKIDYSEIRTNVTAAQGSFFIGRGGRVTQALAVLASLPAFSQVSGQQLLDQLDSVGESVTEIHELVAKLVSTSAGVLPATWFPEEDGATSMVRQRVTLATEAARFLASGGELAEATLRVATGMNVATEDTRMLYESFEGWFGQLAELVASNEETIAEWRDERTLVEAIEGSMSDWTDDVDSGNFRKLQRWLNFTRAVSEIDDESLTEFRVELRTGAISAHEARDAFERALMTATLKEVGEVRDLDVFEYTDHDRRIGSFRRNLGLRQDALRRIIPKMLYDERGYDAAATVGQVGALRQELGSKRRGARSIRALLSTYSELITSLTPCFLMSPDSVANFIEPGSIEFDLVVFDEASQITVQSAVGALGRAKAAVVVGDSKQMPPTTFGGAGGSGEEDEFEDRLAENAVAVITDAESILDECVESRMDREWLAWHYRSEDEVLIQFSNDHYYEKRLASFPGSRPQIDGCGIDYIRVDGQFDHGGKRTNEIEADAIVAEVLRRLSDPIERKSSIGIVTLNAEQQNLITRKLQETGNAEIQRALDPTENEDESEKELLFVLNLESVQGRERDVIILGTSFSKRSDGGRMPLNFGPLTTKGGERRLNVAVTRARRKVVVVTSFDPSDLASANSVGMVHLREYLEMARAVSGGIRRETVRPIDEGHDLHLKSIVSALEARDLVVGSNVGLSSFRVDIAITVKGMEDRWLVGVLLDGPNWASRMLVSDRDALPVDVLQNKMGWRRVERIWLPSWRANPSEIIGDLEALARRLALEPEPEPEVDTSEPEAKVFPESTKVEADVATETAPPAVQGSSNSGQERMASLELVRRSFVPIPKVKTTTTLDDLNADRARGVRCVNDLLRMCGPLRSDVVLKATLNRFGLNQVNANRLREYADLIDPTQLVKSKFGDFAFPEELVGPQGLRRDVFNWYQASKFSERKLDEISPQEFANCAAAIVRGSFSIGEAELASAVLTEFGYSRKSADAIDLATSMIQWCVTEGYFTSSDGTLRIS
jgi:SpoU rRNA methylase family enzyme